MHMKQLDWHYHILEAPSPRQCKIRAEGYDSKGGLVSTQIVTGIIEIGPYGEEVHKINCTEVPHEV